MNYRDISRFFTDLDLYIKCGFPLVQGLLVIANQSENAALQKAIKAVARDVEYGVTFSKSLAKHPDFFDALVVTSVASGEQNSNLDRVISELAGHFKEVARTRVIVGEFDEAQSLRFLDYTIAFKMIVALGASETTMRHTFATVAQVGSLHFSKAFSALAAELPDAPFPTTKEEMTAADVHKPRIAEFLADRKVLPNFYIQLISIGEQTGDLLQVFRRLADYTEDRLRELHEYRPSRV